MQAPADQGVACTRGLSPPELVGRAVLFRRASLTILLWAASDSPQCVLPFLSQPLPFRRSSLSASCSMPVVCRLWRGTCMGAERRPGRLWVYCSSFGCARQSQLVGGSRAAGAGKHIQSPPMHRRPRSGPACSSTALRGTCRERRALSTPFSRSPVVRGRGSASRSRARGAPDSAARRFAHRLGWGLAEKRRASNFYQRSHRHGARGWVPCFPPQRFLCTCCFGRIGAISRRRSHVRQCAICSGGEWTHASHTTVVPPSDVWLATGTCRC